jgi:predicted O-methyltransferase YrrM
MTSALVFSVTADTAALEQIERALFKARHWRELKQVTAQHVLWNGSPSASLMLFQANEALGLRDEAAHALADTISQLDRFPDRDLIARSAKAARHHARWDALAQLRDLQWNLQPDSPAARLRWLESLRLAAQCEAAEQAVDLAWKQRERDPLVIARLAQWLISSSRWAPLALLRTLQWNAEPASGAMRRRWFEALMRTVRSEPDTAVALSWQQRERDPAVLARLSHWLIRSSNWASLARLRSLQLLNDPDSKRVRLLFLEALRRAVQADQSRQALDIALEHHQRDSLVLTRLSKWLVKGLKLVELARLHAFHYQVDPNSPRARLRWMKALRVAAQSDGSIEAVLLAWDQAKQDRAVLARLAQWLIEAGRWPGLAQLRSLQWNAEPESTTARLRFLEALRLAAQSEDASQAVSIAWEQRMRDPALLNRFGQWLSKRGRWMALAQLRYTQAMSRSDPGPYLIRCLDALHRAGQLFLHAPAVEHSLELAEHSPAFLRVLRDKALQWKCLPLLSEIRALQLASGSVSFALVGLHVRALKQQGDESEVARFLQKIAQREGLHSSDASLLRRLMLREGQLDSLEKRLYRDHQADPANIEIMLEIATVHGLRGNFEERTSWIQKVHARLLEQRASATCDQKLQEVTVTSVRMPAQCALPPLVQFPVTTTRPPALLPLIEHLASTTQQLGSFEIWSGYAASDIKTDSRKRAPNDIRVNQRVATFLAHLARGLEPRSILEIGAGFGVSGMYWASALAELGTGYLMTFEPNTRWRAIAEHNIRAICDRVQVVEGTFEEQLAALNIPPQSVDILSVDAIHTVTAVSAQLALAAPLLAPNAVILIDDIKFSPGMYRYWRRLAAAPEFCMSFEIESRMGVLVRNS